MKLGLRHRLATPPNQFEIMAVAEDVWDQLSSINMFKEGCHVQDKVKNSLHSFTYNYIDLHLKEFNLDHKKIRIVNNLTVNFAILKSDKGNGIVLMKHSDYITSVKSLLNDTKFKKIISDPTPTRLSSLQKYLSTLLKRGEITANEYNFLCPRTKFQNYLVVMSFMKSLVQDA